jgi:hypothetical protein
MLALIGVIALAFASYRFGFQSGAEYAGSSDLLFANVLSLTELDTIAAGSPIYYQGSTRDFHFIRVDGVGYYRLRRPDITIPQHDFDGDGSTPLGGIFKTLTMENGKLKAGGKPTGGFGSR